jgi:hypothetical protein
MVGVPGTMKGHIEDARWEATTLDPEEKEWVVMTDKEVNYNWFYPLGTGAECKFAAHLIAKVPQMVKILSVIEATTNTNLTDELHAEITELVEEINFLHPPIVRVEDLPKTEAVAKQMAHDLGVSED